MAQYPVPKEIQPLARLMTDFAHACGYDPLTVFNDFLTFVIHGFSPGAPPLKSWKYKRQQNAAFMGMVSEWVRLMQHQLKEDTSWYDPFGDIYMAFSSTGSKQAQGQFFTPVPVCELMTACADTGEHLPGQRMGDPTCGSGRLLLAWHVRNLGGYLVGEDINHTCCLMTVCNMLVHGGVGEVIWHDSLQPEKFNDGWLVNPVLTHTGIPTIRKMSEEEYRKSRELPVNRTINSKK